MPCHVGEPHGKDVVSGAHGGREIVEVPPRHVIEQRLFLIGEGNVRARVDPRLLVLVNAHDVEQLVLLTRDA